MTTEKAAEAEKVARALMPAVNRYLLAVVECEVTAPRIEHMDRKLLESGDYTYYPKSTKTRLKVEGRLVDPRHLHLMDRSLWDGFYQRRRERVAGDGLAFGESGPLPIGDRGGGQSQSR